MLTERHPSASRQANDTGNRKGSWIDYTAARVRVRRACSTGFERMANRIRRYEFSERLADILRCSRRDLRVRVTLMITGGLVAPGRRGPGAPPATADYAADLLIGVLAAPQQADTVDAIRCYRALTPTAIAGESASPAVIVGTARAEPAVANVETLPLLADRPCFGDALARLLAQAQGAEARRALARQLFGVWLSRGFPVAAVQLAIWSHGRRSILSQRYELPPGSRPPAWLDPERGGTADPGLLHSVFLPAGKLIEIGLLTTPPDARDDERTPAMLDLGPAIANLANLASLARQRRHRRPWQRFLSTAEVAERVTETIDARPSRLAEVVAFGSNPGNLRMLCYVPQDLEPGAPLVVVLHGCTQTAHAYDQGTGWSTLADRYGFAVLLPEQRRANNPLRCFNWFRTDDFSRDGGEALSIREMVERMLADHCLDRDRVFVTGLSAGGAMTSVMLATYPDLFAGGAIVAGVPYRCATGLQDAFETIFQGRSRPAAEWGDLVRSASPHQGPWPRVSVWHGDADATVTPLNAAEILKQWADVHGLGATPTIETTVDGHPYRLWRGASGEDLLEAYTIAGMAHGQPIDASGPDGCGAVQPFINDVGISSAYHIARFWGLTAHRRETAPEPRTSENRGAARPVVVQTAPPAAAGGFAPATSIVDRADPDEAAGGRGWVVPAPDGAADRAARPDPDADALAAGRRAEQDAAAGAAGLDLAAILTQALRAAGLGSGSASDGADASSSEPSAADRPAAGPALPLGIDIPGILATSFEAAGLLKGKSGAQRPSSGGGIGRGIDIQAILTRSFEAAGLLRGAGAGASPAPAARGGLAGTGWYGDGWSRLEEVASPGGTEPALHGYASSGIGCDVGNKVRTVQRTLKLGARPRLSYRRKLDLRAAINMLTTARFAVLVDGVPVDEVEAIGMDYAEPDWTPRTGIDLARFAGRTVTLACEVSANANVCLEVFAKAWIGDLRIEEAPAES
jgi:feruloyl esterase